MAAVVTLLALLALGFAAALLIDRRADLRGARAEAMAPPQGRFVTVEGREMHAVVLGDAGPWVVLIHGASGNARDFTFSFARDLARDYRVVAFDRPGHGYSDPAPGDEAGRFGVGASGPGEQARLLALAAAEIGVRDPIVLGYSYGGSVALAWALDHPAAAVVLVAGVALPWPGGLGWSYDVLGSRLGGALVPDLAAAFVPDSYLEASLASVFAPDDPPPGYLTRGGIRLATRAGTIRINGRQVSRLRPFVVEQSQRYDRLELPIEIVHGDRDTIVPADVHAIPLSQRLPNAHLDLLEGVGHAPHHTRPDAVRDAIARAARRAGLR